MMTGVIDKDELPCSKVAHKFEGHRYGDVGVSFFLVESPPGGGAVLHTHPYEEVFVTLEGEATFTVGDATIEVGAGQRPPAAPCATPPPARRSSSPGRAGPPSPPAAPPSRWEPARSWWRPRACPKS